MAYELILGDHPINRDSRECDRMCHTFIARYLPGAGALREMASTIRVNVTLERVGDYAVTICREAIQLEDPLPEKFAVRIDALADDAQHGAAAHLAAIDASVVEQREDLEGFRRVVAPASGLHEGADDPGRLLEAPAGERASEGCERRRRIVDGSQIRDRIRW